MEGMIVLVTGAIGNDDARKYAVKYAELYERNADNFGFLNVDALFINNLSALVQQYIYNCIKGYKDSGAGLLIWSTDLLQFRIPADLVIHVDSNGEIEAKYRVRRATA